MSVAALATALPVVDARDVTWESIQALLPKLWRALVETLYMVSFSFLYAAIAGLLIGLVLYATRPGNLLQNRVVFGVLSTAINIIRPIPFLIVIITISPLTALVLGTKLGVGAGTFAISVVASVAIARIAESNLVAVDPGAVEAGQAMGAGPWRILFTIVVPEALGSLVLGFTYIVVALFDASAVAGLVAAGGLGHLALTYGWQRFDPFVIVVVIVLLIVLVQLVQAGGNRLSRAVMHRN